MGSNYYLMSFTEKRKLECEVESRVRDFSTDAHITKTEPIRMEMAACHRPIVLHNAFKVSGDVMIGSVRVADSRTTRTRVDLVLLDNKVGRFHSPTEGDSILEIVGHNHRSTREEVLAKDLDRRNIKYRSLTGYCSRARSRCRSSSRSESMLRSM